MTLQFQTSANLYVSMHEAGHVIGTYCFGDHVELMELLPASHHKGKARVRSYRPIEARRLIACGGFATEYLLFKASRIVSDDGAPLTEKEFIAAAMRNAHEDKIAYFGRDFTDSKGYWPAGMDNEFMSVGIGLAAKIETFFPKLELLAATLDSKGRLSQAEVEEIVLAHPNDVTSSTSSDPSPLHGAT